jgi:methylase of polypeptide subunit release factors
MQHHLFYLTLGGQLHACPAGKDGKQLHRVLDAGTGTGIWALDFGMPIPNVLTYRSLTALNIADEHPETSVRIGEAGCGRLNAPTNLSLRI